VLRAIANGPSPGRLLGFGVGCFHFGADPEQFDGDAGAHTEAVAALLTAQSCISDVAVNDPQHGWFESNLPYGLREGGQPFPAIRNLRVGFRLELSENEQSRYWPGIDAGAPESLDISIRQGPSVPIAFVIPTEDWAHPSRGVTFAWHRLSEIDPGTSAIRFDMRGPSPLWLNCYLAPAEEPDSEPSQTFSYERVSLGVGYAVGAFTYDPRAFADIRAAAASLFDELELRAGLFYDIVGARTLIERDWADVEQQREHVLAIESATGVVGYLRRKTTQTDALRRLALSLAEFEGGVDAQHSSLAESQRDATETPGPPFLAAEIDEELRTGFQYPTERAWRLINLFEGRRLVGLQNAAVLASAVAAAAIGAMVGVMFSGGKTGDSNTQTVTRIYTRTVSPPRTTPSRTATPQNAVQPQHRARR
jgi:hypothetical protein